MSEKMGTWGLLMRRGILIHEEFHEAPDADSMEEAIGKFMEGL
jgi:hypothetical protein